MAKHNDRNWLFIKLWGVLFCFLFILLLAGCKKKDNLTGTQGTIEGEKTHSSDQLHSFIIPESLMGIRDADSIVSAFNNSFSTIQMASGEERPIKEVYHDVFANDDGTATYVFTSEQLSDYLKHNYHLASLSRFITEGSSEYYAETSIKGTKFPKPDLTEIIVYVDSSTYDNTGLDGALANQYTTIFMGLYQVMSGVDPYEWHVHVIVKDYITGKVIVDADYPTDR